MSKILKNIQPLLIVLFLLSSYSCGNSAKNELPLGKTWETMTYEEKQSWIENYMKIENTDNDGYALIGYIIDAVKNSFNYPQTVKLDIEPNFINAYVVEADSGWVFAKGKGTANNAFNVPAGFHYSVKWKITPTEKSILDVSISEDK